MARTNGAYSRPSNSFSTPTTGTPISTADADAFFDDLETALDTINIRDDKFSLLDNSDTTKVAKFDVSSITTATTRTLILPDANTTLVGTDVTQELTNKTVNAAVAKGVWTASGTWTIPAVTLGGTLTLNGQTISGAAVFNNAVSGITNLTMTGYADLTEIASPSSPSADHMRLFVKDVGGASHLFTRDSAGTEKDITATAGGGDLVSTNNLSDVASATTSRSNLYAAPFDALAYNGLQINAAMEVSQENESTAVALTSGVSGYTVDGFVHKFVRAATLAITVQQVTPPGSPSFQNAFQKCARATATTGLTPLANGDYFFFESWVEGYRASRVRFGGSAAESVTIGFWVYATIAGTMTVAILNGASDRSYVSDVTINSATTWEYKTVTIAGDQSGTWLYTTGAGLKVRYCFGSGSTFQTAAGAWTAGEFFATASTTNFFASTNNVVAMTGVTIHPGTEAPSAARSPFIMRPYDVELALAQRYYWKTFQQGVRPVQNVGSNLGALSYRVHTAGTAGATLLHVRFPVKMKAAPTITFYSPQAASTTWYNNSDLGNSGASSSTNVGDGGFNAENAQVATDGAGELCVIHAVADAR